MSSLFLSHSHSDKGFIRLLAFDLRVAGVEVWHDEDEIERADPHLRKIETALETVKYVGACLSPHSINSNWVRKEINVAMAREINTNCVVVLPLLLRACQVPPLLTDKLYFDFSVPARYEAELAKLLERIRPEALPEADYPRSLFYVDDARKKRLVDSAGTEPLGATPAAAGATDWVRDWIVEYLVEVRPQRPDGAERYWINLALGEISNAQAEAALWEGLADEDDFARSGAERALRSRGRLP